jgi:hypothetical protein
MKIYQVQLVLINKFGEFKGKPANIDEESLENLVKMSKTFYVSGGFELTCEDESYVIFPPKIVEESILIINKKVMTDIISEEGEKNIQENE